MAPSARLWPVTNNSLLAHLRDLSAYLGGILVIIAIIMGVVGLIRRRGPGPMLRRAAGFMAFSAARMAGH